ncbi:hypothetical protein TBS_27610 [Thermobispora bispora]
MRRRLNEARDEPSPLFFFPVSPLPSAYFPGWGYIHTAALRGAPADREVEMTAIIGAIIIGAIVGVIARLLLPGKQQITWVWTIAIGIVAALIGTALAQVMGVATTPGIDWIELFMQILLAVVGVALFSGIRGRSRGRSRV